LLDVTRLRAGRLETQLEEVDLSELVESVVERFSTDLANCQTVARVELERGTIGRWDQERLDQVVTNLLANVMKYAPGAPVDVVVAKQDGFGILKVRDHGPGLTDEVRERAFDAFERASTTRSIGGLGLGLYIARGIVTAHGGTISVDSRSGEGAEFVVRLPLDRSGQPEAISTTPVTKVESGATK
jgi:signal transduction histidine kinase